jgi:CRISPR-associated protein Csm1
MSSGGKFYVLVPNRGDLAAGLQALRAEIDGWFREQFNGEIAVNLAHDCFPGDQFRAGRVGEPGFGEVLTRLSYRLNQEKRRRGQGALVTEGAWDEAAFLVRRDFWGAGVCASCGKFPGDRPEGICAQCERDRRVGSRLPNARYVAYYSGPVAGEEAMEMPLGAAVRILAKEELDRAGRPYLVARLNDPRLDGLAGYPAAFRYLANHVPLHPNGAPKTFEDIAASVGQGRHLLGYLKADVDYLGMLFAQGLRRDAGGYDTAAHLAALSRELDLFFSGWMQHALSQNRNFQDFYTIFSGGDDLFLVGPWDRAAPLALEVHDRFRDFTGGNPEITLSAGILFTKERYPIARAARVADDVLELSKEHVLIDEQGAARKRDQLTVLGDTLAWQEVPPVLAEITALRDRLGDLKSAFLHSLVAYGELYRLWAQEGKLEGLRYRPLFAYNIARNLRRGDRWLYAWADGMLQSIHGGRENLSLKHLGLIASYLLFVKREERKN